MEEIISLSFILIAMIVLLVKIAKEYERAAERRKRENDFLFK